MKKNYFKVVNRQTREEQVFNSEELDQFFRAEFCNETKTIKYKNQFNDYAVSQFEDDLFKNVVISIFTVAFVVLTSKFILLWI